jgi:hypothetical protein
MVVVTALATLANNAAAADASALKDERARQSYALGMAVGKQLRTQSVDVEPDVYLQGLKDAISGEKTLLTEAESRAAIHRLHVERKQKTAQPASRAAPAPAAGVQVTFKTDPRITKALYMGDRWASQVTYSSTKALDAAAITVEARARAEGASGKVGARWIASDPSMVTIAPEQGADVKLAVHRVGESTVTVKVGERSGTFTVNAVRDADRWKVELSGIQQPPVAGGATAAASTPAVDRAER